jgi:hypothetical protein
VGEFGPGSPPKIRRVDELIGERVCQANAGPCGDDELEEPLISCHGGDEMSKEVDSERYSRSLEVGAEL